MQAIYAILVVFFMILNLVIYHKIFSVFYFDLGKGLLKELIGSFLLACLETGLVVKVGGYALIGIGIILVIAIIKKIVGKVSKKDDSSSDDDIPSTENATTGNDEIQSKNTTESTTESVCLEEGHDDVVPVETALNYVKSNISQWSKVEAIKYFRDATGTDLKTAKEYIDPLYEPVSIPKNEEVIVEKKEKMFCPYCGKQILRTVKFCNFCGKSNSYDK